MEDLVYILGTGSTWSNNEIRYSLRSVEKYFDPLGERKVFVIGEKPEWMINVFHIPLKDEAQSKTSNARAKYLAASEHPEISDDFILMNDDFFFLKEMTQIPNYIRGTLLSSLKNHRNRSGYYYDSLKATRERLQELGVAEPLDFSVHAPIVFNKKKLAEAILQMGTKTPYLLRSAYGNLEKIEGLKTEDFKANNMREFHQQMKRDAEFLSINNTILREERFKKFLREKYPDQSKYENDLGVIQ